MKKRYLVAAALALLLVLALAVVACGGEETTTTAAPSTETTAAPTETTAAPTETTAAPTETTAASTEPIKVGHIVDVTGFEANVGAQFKAGLDYGFTDVTVGGRPVELITADSKSDTASAVDAAKKLVEQDHVVAIFGPTQIGQKTAVAEYVKQAGVPLILYNPVPPEILQDNEWVIGSGGTTLQTPTVIADYISKDLGIKSITTLTTDDTAGKAWGDPLAEYFTALGGTVVQQQWTPFTEDYSSYLTNLEDADALIAWFGGSAGIALLNQYLELGINKKMPLHAMYHGGFTDPFAINTVAQANPEGAKLLVGICAPMAYDPNSEDPVKVEWVEGITPSLPYGPPGDDGYACAAQAAMLFLTAAEATASDLSPTALRDAILATDFIGVEGREFFAPGDQAATKDIFIVKVQSMDIPDVGTIYNYGTAKKYDAVPPSGLSAQ